MWKFTQKEDTHQIEVSGSFLMDDFDKIVIIESITKAKEELVKKAVEELVSKHLITITKSIDVHSLINAVYLGTAKEISKQITK